MFSPRTRKADRSKYGFLWTGTLLLILGSTLALVHALRSREEPAKARPILLNETIIQGLYSRLDVARPDAVLWHVFSALGDEVRVYPSENYYYFSFHAGGRFFHGNLRLAVEDRDRGILHFAYFEYNPDPKHPDDFYSVYKTYGPDSRIRIQKLSRFLYAVTLREKTVRFRLEDLDQTPPRTIRVRPSEDFVFRTWDESGFKFLLLFDRDRSHFLWVLDTEQGLSGDLQKVGPDLTLDRLSEFVFYSDTSNARRILVGVKAINIKRNSYSDGPFDQLADNFVTGRGLVSSLERAYPYTRGRIDSYGAFRDASGTRVSITPYFTYESLADVPSFLESCRQRPPEEFYACICYDYKKDTAPAEAGTP